MPSYSKILIIFVHIIAMEAAFKNTRDRIDEILKNYKDIARVIGQDYADYQAKKLIAIEYATLENTIARYERQKEIDDSAELGITFSIMWAKYLHDRPFRPF